jgi:hypothetical protein
MMMLLTSTAGIVADLDGDDLKVVIILVSVIIILIVSGLTFIITRAMSKTTTATIDNAQQPLVISLGMLTFVALIGALVTNNGDAFTLAATGMGAIAGAVTASWNDMRNRIDRNAQKIAENAQKIDVNKKTITRHKTVEQHPDETPHEDPPKLK